MRALRILGLTLISLGTACGGTEPGGATTGLSLALRGGGDQLEPRGPDASGTTFVISSAEAYVRHIHLDLPKGDRCSALELPPEGRLRCTSGDDRLEIPGPFIVDLVAGTSEPSLAEIALPAGTYRRVDVRFDDGRPDEGLISADHQLSDRTLAASGNFDLEGTSTQFELGLKFNEDARFENAEGIRLDTTGASGLMLWLDVARWFRDVDITTCLTDGDLRIEGDKLSITDDSRSCSDVENMLKTSIKNSGQLDRTDG